MKKYKTKCYNCGTKFEYSLKEVNKCEVICPKCGAAIEHKTECDFIDWLNGKEEE